MGDLLAQLAILVQIRVQLPPLNPRLQAGATLQSTAGSIPLRDSRCGNPTTILATARGVAAPVVDETHGGRELAQVRLLLALNYKVKLSTFSDPDTDGSALGEVNTESGLARRKRIRIQKIDNAEIKPVPEVTTGWKSNVGTLKCTTFRGCSFLEICFINFKRFC